MSVIPASAATRGSRVCCDIRMVLGGGACRLPTPPAAKSPSAPGRPAKRARARTPWVVAKTKARFPRVEGVWADGEPRDRIVAVAEERKADLIVMGTHGRGAVSRAVLGTVAARVVRTSPIPVLTAAAHADAPPRRPNA